MPPSPGRIPNDTVSPTTASATIPASINPDDVPQDAPPDRAPSQRRTLRMPTPDDLQPGTAAFLNKTSDPVRFTLRDEGNRNVRVECEPGGFCIGPVEYIDVMLKRAPQLELVAQRARVFDDER